MAYLRLMIKKLFLFLCIVAYASVAVRAGEPALGESTSQTQAPSGVEFGSGSLEQMLGQAGDEQRLLLVELYATWCRPCRIMERTFADSSVGDYVNDNFVAVRYDVDQYEGDGYLRFTVSVRSRHAFCLIPKGIWSASLSERLRRRLSYRTCSGWWPI